MDEPESETSPEIKRARIKYDRSQILEVKTNRNAKDSDSEIDTRVCALIARSSRGKTKTNSFSKSQDRARDTVNIVLGPQKRTWNTGCHVTQQSAGRDANDPSSLPSRWMKFTSENRHNDKNYSRNSNEYKRDYRPGDTRGSSRRDRGSGRSADGVPFARSYARDERCGRDYRTSYSYNEDEPEWFSEGPTTVNETIELGDILEESSECDPVLEEKNKSKSSERPNQLSLPLSAVENNASLDSFTVSINQVHNSNKILKSASPTNNSVRSSLSNIEPTSSDNQGSRFKHLFQKTELSDESNRANDINQQLLRLLKGPYSSSSDQPSVERNNVLQVENKLRSILLGHSAQSASNPSQKEVEAKGGKPQVLTVEEIEAQLRLPQGDSVPVTSPVRSSENHRTRPADIAGLDDPFIRTSNHGSATKSVNSFPQSETSNNLVPMLQSLMIKQQQKSLSQQQAQMRSSISPFGLISTPMTYRWLKAMTNAVSASARISQLQHSESNLPHGHYDTDYQGSVRQLWVNNTNESASGRQLNNLSNTIPTSSNYNNVLCPELIPRTVVPCSTPTVGVNPGLIRRPVTKTQYTPMSNHNPNSPSVPNVGNPTIMSIESPIQQANRRLLNMTFKQQYTLNNNSDGLINSLPNFQGCGNSVTGPQTSLQSNMSQVPFNNNNNNNNATHGSLSDPLFQQLRSSLRNCNNSLAFLSQLMDWDKAKSTADFDSTIVSMRAKTLEEIEQQGPSKNDTYF